MIRKIPLIIFAFFLLFLPLISKPAFSATAAVEYLCELGITFYKLGRYDDALMEFQKALMLDPTNEKAKSYINGIFKQEYPQATPPAKETQKGPSREEMINQTFKELSKKEQLKEKLNKPIEKRKKEIAPIKLTGETQISLGATPDDIIWKDANDNKVGVPHEKNWRYLWGDQRHNTFDAKIYDRLTLGAQTQFDNPLNAFMELTIDPWTFIGKNHVTITSGTDAVDVDVRYWSGDSRSINETYRSNQAKIIRLKQIKVESGKTTLSGLTIAPANTTFGSIQPMEVNRDYRPVRKLWFDYKQDDYNLKVFPISDEYEALTSDDPLRLSNNHVYWEENPWLDEYEPSRTFNITNQPIKKGRWIRSLAWIAKDSSQHRLTFLRGVSFKANPDAYSLEATIATPMSLWDDYERLNSVDGAVRLKVPLDDLQLGLITTSKLGFNGGSLEALNQVQGIDANYRLSKYKYSAIYGQVAHSYTDIQESKGFDTTYEGIGAKLGFIYDASKESKNGLSKTELYLAHMDGKFYPGLSNYRYTRRDDPTFSRHIYFVEIKPEDEAWTWGDGMDRGRNAMGLKLNLKLLEEKLDTDIKYRNVHADSGKYIESVLRTESTYKINPRLTSKLLAYYQHLPRTHANYDPLIYTKTMYSLTDYFSEEDAHPKNTSVIDDKDPSVGAFGWGAKYDLLEDLLSIEGIYERTNDPLDFPRGLLNEIYNPATTVETHDGIAWDKLVPYIYDQQFFDLPPYDYYNIAKTKFIYTPTPRWGFILSYTFNENKHATGIDDNINHAGLEATYRPTDKWNFWFKYIYSRVVDVYKQNKYQTSEYYDKHYNVFFGSEYKLNKDESFSLLYGEFVGYDDPYQQANWTLSALDTQHLFRIYYRRKF